MLVSDTHPGGGISTQSLTPFRAQGTPAAFGKCLNHAKIFLSLTSKMTRRIFRGRWQLTPHGMTPLHFNFLSMTSDQTTTLKTFKTPLGRRWPHFPALFSTTLSALALVGTMHVGNACAADATPEAVAPRSAAQWQRAAIDDIEAGYRITLENHPGAFDPANPGFLQNLALAKSEGLALAAKVVDGGGYVAAVSRFNVLIHDGHAGMATNLGAALPERWPGFITAWRTDTLYVQSSEPDGPPVGASVVACDGKSIKQLITDNVFAFQARMDEPGHWWVHARKVFFDRGNPFISIPMHCQFVSNGKVLERDLSWRPMNDQARKLRDDSYNGDALKVGLTEPRPKLFWVAMPSFQPDEEGREAYRAMTKEIVNHRGRYLDSDAIVIDLRQNQGGSSTWSRNFASALWGKERVERRVAALFAKTEVWWRASKDNTQYMTELVDVMAKQKRTEDAEWARKKSIGMQGALADGNKFYIPKEDTEAAGLGDPNVDVPGDPLPFTRPLYVLVPGQCASACLDALDVFTLFPNTKLIGAPSAADSTYMDVRMQELDSGLARVIIPNKVYVNRPRANGQVYMPSIFINDLVWSTENMLKTVEADLKKMSGQAVIGKRRADEP